MFYLDVIMQNIYTVSAVAIGMSILPPLLKTLLQSSDNQIVSDKELNQFKGDDGFLISTNVRLSMRYSKEHVIIFGPTGIGKTNHIVKHNIQHLKEPSIICTDPSGDIMRDVHREDCKAYVFNPQDITKSIGYDPLIMCTSEYEVRNIMETLILNGFQVSNTANSDVEKWVKLSSPLLKLYAVYNFKYRKYNFSEMINRVLSSPVKMHCTVSEKVEREEPTLKQSVGKDGKLKYTSDVKKVSKIEQVRKIDTRSIEYEILQTKDKSLIEEFYSFLRTIESPETFSNIQLTLNSALALFKDENVRKLCSKNPFDFRKLRKEKAILYIQIPEKLSRYFAPLTSILIQQLIDVCRDNPNGLDILFVLDELCNVGIIPDLDKSLSTIRRYNIGVMGCTQSLAQLEILYGEAKTRVILENFNTCCAMSGLSETGSYFSNLLGYKTFDEDKPQTSSQNVMTIDEIRRLDENKILIVCKNRRGVIDKLLPFFKVIKL